MKLSTALDGFKLHMLGDGYSQNSISLYLHYLKMFCSHLDDPDIETITETMVQKFYVWIQTEYKPVRFNKNQEPLSKSSVNKVWVALRTFYGWIEETFHQPRQDGMISQVEEPEIEIVPFSESEIKLLLRGCKNVLVHGTTRAREHYQRRPTATRDESIIRLLTDTGVRASEFCRLTREDADLVTGALTVKRWGSGRKTKNRTVYIGNYTKKSLWLYINTRTDQNERLFVTDDGCEMDRNTLKNLISGIADNAGVKHAYPHRFRHTFAIQYLRNGGDVFTLQKILGHTSWKMVRRYLAIAQVDIANAHRRASPIDNWKI